MRKRSEGRKNVKNQENGVLGKRRFCEGSWVWLVVVGSALGSLQQPVTKARWGRDRIPTIEAGVEQAREDGLVGIRGGGNIRSAAAECSPPAAIWVICPCPAGKCIIWGNTWSNLCPCPNCPDVFFPHPNNSPSSKTNKKWVQGNRLDQNCGFKALIFFLWPVPTWVQLERGRGVHWPLWEAQQSVAEAGWRREKLDLLVKAKAWFHPTAILTIVFFDENDFFCSSSPSSIPSVHVRVPKKRKHTWA